MAVREADRALRCTRLDQVVITVSDWNCSIAFYRDVLGTQVVDHPDGRVVFRFGDQQLDVHGPGLDVGPLGTSPPVAPGGSDLCLVWSTSAPEERGHRRTAQRSANESECMDRCRASRTLSVGGASPCEPRW